MYVFPFILGICVFYVVMIIMLWGVIRKHVLFRCKCAPNPKKKEKEKGIFVLFLHVKRGGLLSVNKRGLFSIFPKHTNTR